MNTRWLVCFIYFIGQLLNVGTQINFSLSPRTVQFGQPATFLCSPFQGSLDTFNRIFEISFTRKRNSEEDYSVIVVLRYSNLVKADKEIEWLDKPLKNRASLTGELGAANVSFATFTISGIDCTDEGSYMCNIYDVESREPYTKRRFLRLSSNEGNVHPITAAPINTNGSSDDIQAALGKALQISNFERNPVFSVGNIGIFNCTSDGSIDQPNIRWCILRPGDDEFTYLSHVGIQFEQTGVTPQDSCLYFGTILLVYSITENDNGTYLSCSALDEPCSHHQLYREEKSSLEKQRTFKISVVEAHLNTRENQIQVENVSSTSTVDGSLVLITIGILILIIGLSSLSLAVFTYIKSRKIKAEYEDMRQRDRYQTLSLNHVNNTTEQMTYEVMRDNTETSLNNYVNGPDLEMYAEVG